MRAADVPYPHLLNFFQSDRAERRPARRRSSTGFWSTRRAVAVRGDGDLGQSDLAANSTGHAFHPPFNRISTYREPGRINLNTIYSPDGVQRLMNGYRRPPTRCWQSFVQSRRNDDRHRRSGHARSELPTEFARPFRSFGGGRDGASRCPALQRRPRDQRHAVAGRSDGSPQRRCSNRPTTRHPTTTPTATRYFRYQGLQRLGNLVTTRSNVYAVWITVGYFEVTPVPPHSR